MSMKTIDMFARELDALVKKSQETRERAQAFKDRLREEVNSDEVGAELLHSMITLLNRGEITRDQIVFDQSSEDGTVSITYIIKPKHVEKKPAAEPTSEEVA